jgi:hypothetical protein
MNLINMAITYHAAGAVIGIQVVIDQKIMQKKRSLNFFDFYSFEKELR